MNRNRKIPLLAAATSILLVTAAAVGVAGSGTAATLVAPSNQTPPTLSGTPEVGKTLTASPGSWSGTQPISFVYRFQRCNSDGGECFTGGSTTQRTYRLTGNDLGRTVRVRVTASNKDGSANATSVPTAVVRAAPAPAPAPASGCGGNAPLQISTVAQPERLLVEQALVSPSVITRSTLSLTVRVRVTCSGKAVQGALVDVAAVPFNQFSSPGEQTTGTDGFAQITMNQLSGFPAAERQQLLVFFIRARKAGENILGGVSTRRLVSTPVNLNQ